MMIKTKKTKRKKTFVGRRRRVELNPERQTAAAVPSGRVGPHHVPQVTTVPITRHQQRTAAGNGPVRWLVVQTTGPQCRSHERVIEHAALACQPPSRGSSFCARCRDHDSRRPNASDCA